MKGNEPKKSFFFRIYKCLSVIHTKILATKTTRFDQLSSEARCEHSRAQQS